MNSGGLILVIGAIASAVAAAIIWLVVRRTPATKQQSPLATAPPALDRLDAAAKEQVEHIFDANFREELRNRGRLHFEKVLGENAMFLQQDLRQTTTQLNDYMRTEITRTLQIEFKKYEQSIADAKQIALGSIEKTIATIDQQRQLLQTQMQTQSEAQKAHIIEQFEISMASIINHYILRAIGNQIDLSDQLDFILSELEANKAAITEDIKRGA
ncbi:MAG: hypothetical protein WD877_01710 [Candidatus Saccharimonadales bacterium]